MDEAQGLGEVRGAIIGLELAPRTRVDRRSRPFRLVPGVCDVDARPAAVGEALLYPQRPRALVAGVAEVEQDPPRVLGGVDLGSQL